MSIETITEKIVSDAVEYADGLIAEAEKEAEQIRERAALEAAGINEHMDELIAKDSHDFKHKSHSAAELESRKRLLAAKQYLLALALDTAVDRLASMEEKKYIAFLAERMASIGEKEGVLILNEKDKKTIGKKLVKAANEALCGGMLTLSDEVMDAKGGFILRQDSVEINVTLEAMVASVKEKIAAKVVRELVKKQYD